jgi:gas vesicle protein
MSDKSDFGAFLAGFLLGGIAGAAAALLLTPQSGEETRTVIKEKAIELKEKALDTYEDVSEKASTVAADYKVKATDLVKEAKVKAEEVGSKGQVILEEQKAKVTETARKIRKTDPKEPEAEA